MARIHHVGIAVDSIDKALSFHVEGLGMTQVSAVVHDELQKVKVVLLSTNGANPNAEFAQVELVEPVGESPVTRILQRKNHLYHYCIEVPSLDTALQQARTKHAIIVTKPLPAKLFNGRKIAFIWTPNQYLVEYLEKTSQ